MKKRALSLLLAVLMLVTALPVMASAANMTFNDVPTDAWFYADVKNAFEKDLINGKNATTFAPYDNLTYAEAVKLAAAMNQKFNTGSVTLQNGNPWYQSYVDYAKTAGIISKDYDWNKAATRAGYMEIFAKALPDTALPAINVVADGSIPDVPMTHPQAAAIYKLYRAGILQGSSDYVGGVLTEHLCKPSDNIRRCEVAAILTRMMDASKRVSFSMGTASALVATLPNAVSGLGGSTVKIDAGVAGGTPPYACQWQYSTNGSTWTNGAAGTGVTSYTYSIATSPATQYVRLNVTDAAGKTVTSNTCTVTLGTALTASIPAAVSATAGVAVTIASTVSGGKTPYTYAWQFSLDGTNWNNGATTKDYAYTPASTPATQYVRLTVKDAENKTVTTNTCTVTVGNALAVSIPATASQVYNTGATAKIPATVTGGTAPYTYSWRYTSPSNVTETSGNTNQTYEAMPSIAVGTWKFWCVVTDKNGNTATSNICTLTVSAAATPLTVSIPATLSGTTGQHLNIPATVNGGTSPYTYKWFYARKSDSAWQTSGDTDATYDPVFSEANTWQCWVRVTDAKGNIAESEVCNITVTAAATPLSVSIPATASAKTNETLHIPATVSGGTAPYTYKWYYARQSDSTWQTSSDSDATYDPSFGEANIWQCWVRVTDAKGNYKDSNWCTITVTAAASPLSVTVSAPSTATAGISATLTANVTGGKAPYTINWYRAKASSSSWGTLQGTGTTYYASFMEAGAWQVLCDVYDADGKNVYKTVTITVSAPASPLSVSIPSSASAKTGQTLNIAATVSGGTAPYTYKWRYARQSDSAWQTSGDTDSVYNPTFNEANTWECWVGVTDAKGNTAESGICWITVTSSVPTLSVSLPSSSLSKNVASHYTPSISGGSGSYTYSWSWSGPSSGTSSWSYLNVYGWKTGTYTVTVNVTDNSTGAKGSATATLTIGNW